MIAYVHDRFFTQGSGEDFIERSIAEVVGSFLTVARPKNLVCYVTLKSSRTLPLGA
jgi:hypothetical protein